MFIELTDHLRCPADHEEQFLVLLPDRMEGRSVLSGELGCPVCGRVVRVEEGVADFGAGTPGTGDTSLTGEAVPALLGVTGPGGYVALVGSAARLGDAVASRL